MRTETGAQAISIPLTVRYMGGAYVTNTKGGVRVSCTTSAAEAAVRFGAKYFAGGSVKSITAIEEGRAPTGTYQFCIVGTHGGPK